MALRGLFLSIGRPNLIDQRPQGRTIDSKNAPGVTFTGPCVVVGATTPLELTVYIYLAGTDESGGRVQGFMCGGFTAAQHTSVYIGASAPSRGPRHWVFRPLVSTYRTLEIWAHHVKEAWSGNSKFWIPTSPTAVPCF